MKSKMLVILILTFKIATFGQKSEYHFFDKNWKTTNKEDAIYTREITRINDTLYKIDDTDKAGKTLMSGEYISLNPLTENGFFKFTAKACGFDTITGRYRNGLMIGDWVFKAKKRQPITIDYDFILENCHNSIGVQKNQIDTYVVVEDMPTFNGGGLNSFRDYITKSLHYPPMPALLQISGTVWVRFTVNKSGEVCNISITKSSLNKDLDREVLRAVSQSPKWKPGTQRGEPIGVMFTVPLLFKLD